MVARGKLALIGMTGVLLAAMVACGSRLPASQLGQFGPGGAGQGVAGAQGGTDASGAAAGDGTADGAANGTDGAAVGDGGGKPGQGTGAPAGSCKPSGAGAPGVTANSITVANVSDISGPIPGLFQDYQRAAQAYAAYANATRGGICGRQIKVLGIDTGSTTNGDKSGAQKACKEAFAMVGSYSAVDAGGAPVVDDCGIPEIRAGFTTSTRRASKVSFAANSGHPGRIASVQPDYFRSIARGAERKAAFLYINVEAAATWSRAYMNAYKQRGFTWEYVQPIDVSDVNYSPYVLQMKNKGIQYVQFIGVYQHGVRLAKAMEQQGFKPKVFVPDPTMLDPRFAETGGSAVQGAYTFIDTATIGRPNAEFALYSQWLQKVAPGAKPVAPFGWSAMRLFDQEVTKLGPKPTRQALLAALGKVRGWTSNNLHARFEVGAKESSPCRAFLRLQGQTWKQVAPASGYRCGTLLGGA